jgi:hypothetical protein
MGDTSFIYYYVKWLFSSINKPCDWIFSFKIMVIEILLNKEIQVDFVEMN